MFKYKYGYFEYYIVFFRLVNALVVFQVYINLALCKYMNQFVVADFNNIVMYLNTIEEHT